MRAALALLLASSLASAEPPADAPLVEGRSIPVVAGDLVSFDGWLIEDSEMVRRGKVSERNAAELAKLKLKQGAAIVSVPVLVAVVATALAVGVAVGIGATLAAQRPR